VAHIANTFVACDAIVIVRVKDRFVEKPSPGGWRDLMINFYLADDPNQHICEVQIVSSKLLVARKGLKENINYARTRNALEILERLDAKDPAKRWSRARYLRDVEKVSAGSLFSLGYEVFDLLKAGYSEEDFKDAIGLDDKDLKAAREQLVEECLNRADILAMAQGGSKSGKSGRFGGSAKSSRQRRLEQSKHVVVWPKPKRQVVPRALPKGPVFWRHLRPSSKSHWAGRRRRRRHLRKEASKEATAARGPRGCPTENSVARIR